MKLKNDNELIINHSIDWLLNNQKINGSWSSACYKKKSKKGDVAATSYVIKALVLNGITSIAIKNARKWLIDAQNKDGGWGLGDSNSSRSHIGLTAYALSALAYTTFEHDSAEAIQNGLYFLYNNQSTSGCWSFSPTSDGDLTLSSYVLRALIDLDVLKGIKLDRTIIVNWYDLFSKKQNHNGSWSDWFGNKSSIESASYFIEIAFCSGIVDITNIQNYEPIVRTLNFINNHFIKHNGWTYDIDGSCSLWLTHNVLISISHLIKINSNVSLKLDCDTIFQNDENEIYDFAISFAGQDRLYARQLALSLKSNGIKVFFDEFKTSELWGNNLTEDLSFIYSENARFCIMLLSKYYIDKGWLRLEKRSALAKSLQSESSYILPILLDNELVFPKGILKTTSYITIEKYTINDITNLALLKLKNI